ncbi:MAG TPA: response regulator [Candidatus Polarisedimenticolaceae bacterium]|nr:response regulator [Candidatus Polarisedimenticolaceae bacterium]
MNPGVNGEANLVLVVDDNESGRYGKCRALRQAGFEVLEAAAGAEALQLARQRGPRLVVLDINLPDLSGWDVCRQLKSDPRTASTIVLQISATHVREEDTVRSLEAGADASLTEPLDGTVLIATVRALLRARAAEDALRCALVEAESANRAKDEFLATLSHELRSPLGAILTWATLLRADNCPPEQVSRGLEAIERNARLQVKLIEDLLDVSRIISGKMRLELGLVELDTVVDAALEAVRPAAEVKQIRLERRIDPTVGPVSADSSRLQQVVWNLLSNAVKFTPRQGQVRVWVEGQNSQAVIGVTDTGRGIDAAFLPHIFERFRQADSSTTRTEGGLGLGLAIVRHLVELHGGTVEAASDGVKHGATFCVRLPLPAVRPAAERGGRPLPPGAALDPAWPSLSGLHVLVLDDERDAREAITAVLEDCGARVTAASSVGEALAALASEPADLVVSDIAMPHADGYEFIRRALRLPREGARLRTLALTAHAGRDERTRILDAGFDDYLAKPIDASELAATVARLADSRSR